MGATCGVGMMVYILPMLLGRTYDKQRDTVGIDIYDEADIANAVKNPFQYPEVTSLYETIETLHEKRDFLGISGELGLKVASGLVDIRGSGQYLKDTSNVDNSVEILIKLTFKTLIQEIHPDAKPLNFWHSLKQESVGTHVVTSLIYGGEVYASVKFIAHKAEYLEHIKGQIDGTIAKSGAFDIKTQGKLNMLAQNMSSKAKMEIDYYATAPLKIVPTSIEDLGALAAAFKDQVGKINNGTGVAICAGFRPLSDFNDKFSFIRNQELMNELDDFSYKFNNLRQAKSLLKSHITSLPETVSEEYMKQLVDFSDRLTKTLTVFHEVIAELDLQADSKQLEKADDAFIANSKARGDNRYTIEIKKLIKNMGEKEDPNIPRGIYIRWGRRSCGPKTGNILYIGFMSSFIEKGVGAGTKYQCLPENPDLHVDPDATGVENECKLAAARYRSLSVFKEEGQKVEEKVASCAVCQTPMRPTIKVFPAMTGCPGDWFQEYTGFIVSTNQTRSRAEFVCLDFDPDSYEFSASAVSAEPVVLPIKTGNLGIDGKLSTVDASMPCAVCSK